MKTYYEARRKHLNDLSESSSGGFLAFGAILLIAVIVIALSLHNTASMQSVSTDNAKEYVSELTAQIAGTVTTDVSDKKTSLASIAESLRLHFDDGLEETNTDDYLRNHLRTLFAQTKFDYLIFQHIDAEVIQFGTLPDELGTTLDESHPIVQEAEEKDECVAYVDNSHIVYAVPVHSGGEIVGTLIAGTGRDSLSTIMKSHIYQTETSYCVTNREGKLLIEAGNDKLAEASEALSLESSRYHNLAAELRSDFAAGMSGIAEVELQDSQNYLLAYAPITNEDWMIVTLVPTNLFSKTYISYMKRALLYTVAAALVFAILVVLLVLSYRGARKKLEDLAYSDELTAGINNTDFQLRYNVLQRKANPLEYSIVMLDINDFKLINEMGSFQKGDELIRYVYNAIVSTLDEKQFEFACRAEMDHFFICMHENSQEGIQAHINKIETLVNQAGKETTLGFHITFGQGACICDDAETDVSELEERARIAKQAATPEQRATCVMYNEEIRHAISAKVQLDYMAEESLKNGDFIAYFQPKVSLHTGEVKGAEALARWNHPHRGLISPADFVPVLEASGHIREVDLCVFEHTCRYLSERKHAGKELFPISVNLSRVHFWRDDFMSTFIDILQKYDVDPRYIEFEITETLFMETSKLNKVKEGIALAHEYGFTVALDDFGVGYSSLSLVNEMDFDTIKLDRSFFLSLEDAKNREIVSTLFAMGNKLGLDMVVEGIETQAQIDFLASEQIDVIQGYFYSKPLSESEFGAWVDMHSHN